MDCYFSMEILTADKQDKLENLLKKCQLPFEHSGSITSSGKVTLAGSFSNGLHKATEELKTFSDGLKSNGFSHIIRLDNSDSMLFETYTFNWPRDDYV